MTLGVLYPANAAPEGIACFARWAEQLDYDELWVAEDRYASGGLALAATALAATGSMRVGVRLLPGGVRNAMTTAMEIATLGRLHPGRVSVALGYGGASWTHQAAHRPAEYLAIQREFVLAVRMLLAGETVNASGSLVRLEAAALQSPPEAIPEILIGAADRQGIALARRFADGLLLPEGCGPEFVAHSSQLAAASAAAPLIPWTVAVQAWLYLGEDGVARRVLGNRVSHWLDTGLYSAPTERRSRVPLLSAPSRPLADELAIVGGQSDCLAAVSRFLDAGADRLITVAVGPDPGGQYEAFARQILPALRRSRT